MVAAKGHAAREKWYDKALELLLGPAYQIFANRDQIVDAITKGWNAAVQFYQEHKRKLILLFL